MFLKHHGNVHIVCLLSLPVSFSGENFLFGIKSFAQWDLQWLSILPLFFGKYSFHFFKNRAIMKSGRNVMYTSKMWFYILYIGKNMIKIIIKQSKQIVQTKTKSQKLKKKTNQKKIQHFGKNARLHRQISSCASNQGFGSELFPILLSRKVQFAKCVYDAINV